MADEFRLPPAANGFQLTVDFTADQRAYVEDWYAAVKDPGENVTQFVLRMFVSEALNYRRRVILAQVSGEANSDRAAITTTERTDRQHVNSEANDVYDELTGGA